MVRAKRTAVADRLHSIAIRLLRHLRQVDTETGLGPARLSALSVLVFGGPRSLGELAEAEQVTAPTMSNLVARLEEDGLATRTPSGRDRRSVVLSATRKGKQILERGRTRRLQRFESLLSAATPTELDTLSDAARILDRILS